MLGPEATPEQIAALSAQMGLDLPIWEQLFIWFKDILHGDFGDSLFYNKPVVDTIVERLEPTVLLMIMSLIIALLIGVPAGILAALKRNTFIDRIVMALAMLGVSVPSFWLGLNLILLFSLRFSLFPATGYVPVSEGGLVNAMWYLFLPAFSLGFQYSAEIARMMRSSMLDVLNNDYIRTARAKGLTRKKIILVHAFKNAMIPTLTTVGLAVANLAGGAVVTETVFNIPGVGKLAVNSIMRRDYSVIQGHILFVALLYVVVNLVIDILYKKIDPRVELK